MKHTWKKAAAGLLAMALVVGAVPANVGTGGLFGGTGITAYADETETLLTTLTFGGSSTYSETKSGVVSVTATNVTSYNDTYGWLFFDVGSLSVTAEEGYTINKCVFRQNNKQPITDTEAPFEIHFSDGCCTEDTNWDMDGVTSIEVYRYVTPTTVDVTGVSLNKNVLELNEGKDETLTAIVDPDDATDKTVTWSSSNTDVATVDANGKVSAVGAGSATIKATATNGTEDTSDDKEDYCTVIVKYPFTAKSITIDDFTYDGKEKTPVLKYGNTVLREGTDYVLDVKEGDIASATDAGTYTIHINGKGDYAGENIALTWKINKADVNVTADAKSKKYGEDDPVLTYTAGSLFGTDAFTGALARAEGEAVNTYAITQGTLSAGDNYNINFTGADFTINKADPTPDAVTGLTAAFGKKLSDVTLPTGWTWDAPDTSVGDVGNNTFAATFTPTDTANYNNYSANLTVAVTAISATPTAVGTLNATYGDTLADVDLPTPEDGTWAWKDAGTTSVGNAGEQTFTAVFTPSSPNYTAVEQDVTINVAKADPTPDAVTGLTVAYGKKLSDIELPDGWAWDAPATSVGNVGNNPFAATYTPTDTDNYNTLNQNLTVNVVAVDKTSLNEAIAAANTYRATIQKTVYADPALALDSAITDAKAVAENDNVTEAQVAQAITDLNNAVTTAKAAVKDIDDTKAAQAVTDKINALPAVENIKSTDKEAVEAARAAYNALVPPDQTGKVTEATLAKLTAAEKAVADHIAADAVIAKINAISEVVLTNQSKALIDAARTAYEALATDAQKALVSNYTTLTADEQKYSDLQVADVKAKIDAIGDIELSDESKAAIDTARAAFKALNADQQALVANAKVLDYAEKLYEALDAKDKADKDKTAAEKSAAEALDKATKADKDKAAAETEAAKALDNAAKAAEAQAKAEAEAAAAKTAQANAEKAQATAEKAAADAKTAQTKAEEEAAAAKTAQATAEKAQATAEKAAADAKTAQTKAEEEAAAAKTAQANAEKAQATAEKAAADAKTAQTKAEEEAAAAKTAQANAEKAQATAEKAAADAKTAQTKAEEEAAAAKTAQATAEKAQATAEKAAADAKTAQTKAEEEAAAAKTAQANAEKAQATAEKAAADAKTAQTKAEEEAAAAKTAQATAEKAQATAEKAAADAKTAQTKAEEDAAAAKTAQATAEKNAETAKAAQAKAEEDAAAAKTAQATAEKNAETAKAAQAKAEEDAAAAKAAQATAEKAAADAKTAQTKAEEDAAAAKAAQATAEKNAEAANSKVSDLTEQLAAAVKQIEELESSGNVDEALKKQVAELKEQLDAAKTAQNEANEALAKAQDVAAAKIAAAEAAQEKAEEEATAAEKAQATAEQTAKEATEKAAAAEKAQATAEQTAKEATEKAAAAEKAQATAEQTAKEATEKAAAAEKAQATAEQTAKEATEKAAAAEKAQATAEQNAKEATEKAAAAEEAQKVAEAAQAEAEKKAAEDKAAADQAAADKVIKLIDAIGNVEKTNTSENKIVAARAAYDALTDEQKALVTNYTVLTKAESAYKTLPQTGMSGFHKVFAGLAALMGITGMGLIKKSRKEDEEE